jgi:protein-L-isoaspartate(D-aspartate) O-methyltransferase
VTTAPASHVDHATLRRGMIDSQLRTVGVMDESVLVAMNTVARERFVPEALVDLAYADAALEVAPGRWLLEPMVLALLLQRAGIKAGSRTLVVGAASGYSAAVLSHMGANVTALESDPALIAMARAAGVDMVEGPLAQGWAAGAPYDLILFEGAIETIPPAFASQIASGGQIAAVLRDGGVGRACVGLLVGGTRIGGLPFLEVGAKLLPGFAAPRRFEF